MAAGCHWFYDSVSLKKTPTAGGFFLSVIIRFPMDNAWLERIRAFNARCDEAERCAERKRARRHVPASSGDSVRLEPGVDHTAPSLLPNLFATAEWNRFEMECKMGDLRDAYLAMKKENESFKQQASAREQEHQKKYDALHAEHVALKKTIGVVADYQRRNDLLREENISLKHEWLVFIYCLGSFFFM